MNTQTPEEVIIMRGRVSATEWVTIGLAEELSAKGVALEIEDGRYIIAVPNKKEKRAAEATQPSQSL